MRSIQRYLILGLASTMTPIGIVVTAPPARADCNSAGTTVCAQGEVRGPDGVPRAATPVVPYPCEYDWYCGTEWDLDVRCAWPETAVDIGPGRPGGTVGSDHELSNYPMTRQPLDEGANMLSAPRPARRAVIGAIGAGDWQVRCFSVPPPPQRPSRHHRHFHQSTTSSAVHGRRVGARDVRRHVRHVELPRHPPRRQRFLHQPQRPTQRSDPGSGTELSRRQLVGSGRASAHPATLGRLPPTLWGSGDPLTGFDGAVCGARPFGRRRQCG